MQYFVIGPLIAPQGTAGDMIWRELNAKYLKFWKFIDDGGSTNLLFVLPLRLKSQMDIVGSTRIGGVQRYIMWQCGIRQMHSITHTNIINNLDKYILQELSPFGLVNLKLNSHQNTNRICDAFKIMNYVVTNIAFLHFCQQIKKYQTVASSYQWDATNI